MIASINSIKNRFNKKQLFILADYFHLSKDGTKEIISEKIFECNKTYNELCDIVDNEKNGLLCCVCLNKENQMHMYSCKTCKEGIVCDNCIDNDVDDDINYLCPICKVSPIYSNYKKEQLKNKCELIKKFSEKNNISITKLFEIISITKKEQFIGDTLDSTDDNYLTLPQKKKVVTALNYKFKTMNINEYQIIELWKLI